MNFSLSWHVCVSFISIKYLKRRHKLSRDESIFFLSLYFLNHRLQRDEGDSELITAIQTPAPGMMLKTEKKIDRSRIGLLKLPLTCAIESSSLPVLKDDDQGEFDNNKYENKSFQPKLGAVYCESHMKTSSFAKKKFFSVSYPQRLSLSEMGRNLFRNLIELGSIKHQPCTFSIIIIVSVSKKLSSRLNYSNFLSQHMQ